MLGIVYKGVAFPLLFTTLNKQGNSNTKERIDLINQLIKLFGKQVIDFLVADRAFVDEKWFLYFNNNNIRYYIKLMNLFMIRR